MIDGSYQFLQMVGISLSAGAYIAVAWLLGERRVGNDLAHGQRAIRAWWGGMGVALGSLALLVAITVSASVPLILQLALLELFVLAASLAGAGLIAHLLVIVTGRPRIHLAMWPLFLGYALAFTALLLSLDIRAITLEGSDLKVDSNLNVGDGNATQLMMALFAPHLLGGFAYATLALRAPTRTARYRAFLVAASIMLVSLGTGFTLLADELGSVGAQAAAMGVGLISPLVALFAYAPPAWARRVLGVDAIGTSAEVLEVVGGPRQ